MNARTDLIAARERLGITQRNFAKLIKLRDQTMVSRVEAGWRDPSMAVARRWVEALGPGVTMDLFRPPPVFDEALQRSERRQRIIESAQTRLEAALEVAERAFRVKQDRALRKFEEAKARLEKKRQSGVEAGDSTSAQLPHAAE